MSFLSILSRGLLLRTLLSQSPTSVLLPSVLGANRRRLSSVQKLRKTFFSDGRMERREHSLRAHSLPVRTARGRGSFIAFSTAGRGRGSRSARASGRLTRKIPVQIAASPHASLPPSWIEVSCAELPVQPASWGVRCPRFAVGTLVWSDGREASACSTMERKVRLHYPDSIFIPQEWMVFAGNIFTCSLKGSALWLFFGVYALPVAWLLCFGAI